MNVATCLVLLVTGFGVPFAVLDLSWLAAGRRWPVASERHAENFRPFAVFLALLAGPALFISALWRSVRAGQASMTDCVAGMVIAGAWALCYGVVLLECLAFAGLRLV
ncbi:DUF6949 family protein [Pararhizobium gei]|uniref:DUF6949 family protein n=1 Tax=Pararhizobium gei TaxID=1395951 RepID=UPI0023DC3D10|nr:hypothetical protein [Rhizobium gei]